MLKGSSLSDEHREAAVALLQPSANSAPVETHSSSAPGYLGSSKDRI
jgi:hypothetical protein